jgi:hypothetical protein
MKYVAASIATPLSFAVASGESCYLVEKIRCRHHKQLWGYGVKVMPREAEEQRRGVGSCPVGRLEIGKRKGRSRVVGPRRRAAAVRKDDLRFAPRTPTYTQDNTSELRLQRFPL